MVKNALVVYDGSDASIKALSYALSLMEAGGRLTVLFICDLDRYIDIKTSVERLGLESEIADKIVSEMEARLRKQLSEFLKKCKECEVKASCKFKVGKFTEEILNEVSSSKYDLLILPHGGSLEEKMEHILVEVLKIYPRSVLIVK